MEYYRITHSMVERAITLYNSGKMNEVELCATVKMCHPFKYKYVIGWATESVLEENIVDILDVTEREMDLQILRWTIEEKGIVMLPALRCGDEILTWENAKSHDSLYFNFGIERSYEFEHGFITSLGKFLNREEAGKMAYKTYQWRLWRPLYSGDAEQFTLQDIESGEVRDYYSSLGIPEVHVPVTSVLVKLLLYGYAIQYKRESAKGDWRGKKPLLERIAHLKELLHK